MSWLGGADGCRGGWVRVSLAAPDGALHCEVVEDAGALLGGLPDGGLLAVDVPIGLPARERRDCDVAARRLLGVPRGSSVFPAPIRPALAAASRAEADRITRAACGRGVPAQAFGLFAKIRDMDEALARRPELGGRVREVHPEVSFAAWAGAPIAAGKKSAEGRAARAALVDAWLPGAYAAARASLARARAADDDLLDAFAALWTACRIARGEAVTLPSGPPRDLRGLAMEIVY